MRRITSVKENRHKVKQMFGWDEAIAEAQRKLDTAKERVRTIQHAIKQLCSMKASGDRFPDDSATHD
jgi:hypothetical protein